MKHQGRSGSPPHYGEDRESVCAGGLPLGGLHSGFARGSCDASACLLSSGTAKRKRGADRARTLVLSLCGRPATLSLGTRKLINQGQYAFWRHTGVSYGATDEWSYKAVENPMYCSDLHASLLRLLGIDHTRPTFRHNGLDRRLTDVHGLLFANCWLEDPVGRTARRRTGCAEPGTPGASCIPRNDVLKAQVARRAIQCTDPSSQPSATSPCICSAVITPVNT